jgi:hypothetical protein
MRSLTVAIWLCIGAMTGAQAQTQASTVSSVSACAYCKGAPAPSIGSGIPAALVLGGVLLAATYWKRWRQS